MIKMHYYAGIEAGGTKFRCIIASGPDHIIADATFQTTIPEETLPQVINFIKQSVATTGVQLVAAGLSCFGPVDLEPSSATFGYITTTPKLKWRNFPILNYIRDALQLPMKFETDVNGAAIGEGKWGAAHGISDFVYITVGTGIGGGIIQHGKPLYGMTHPEIGHMKIQPHPEDSFSGNCPYHTTCLEGLANAPALAERWKVDPSVLPDDHPAWKFEAYYLGQAIHNLILVCAPKRIILGGGVLKRQGLIEKVRLQSKAILNGYVETPYLDDMDTFVLPPALGDLSGALGAIAMLTD
jgi:fructokinase